MRERTNIFTAPGGTAEAFNFSCYTAVLRERARGLSKDFLRIQMQIVDDGADFTNIDRPEGGKRGIGIHISVELVLSLSP